MRLHLWKEYIRDHDCFMVFEKSDRLNWLIGILRHMGVTENKIFVLSLNDKCDGNIDIVEEKYRKVVLIGNIERKDRIGFLFDGDWEDDRDVVNIKDKLIAAGCTQNDILSTSDDDEVLYPMRILYD